MPRASQQFGGNWSMEKLEYVRKYLSAYTTILRKRPYKFAYIDAFAGTGYQELKLTLSSNLPLIPELLEDEPQQFLDGSARNALNTKPSFQKYIFIEKDENKLQALNNLKIEFSPADIDVIHEDCNVYLQRLCRLNWSGHRAVLFLDPFGMQVEWKTIQSIASTKAIDLWILFPLGVAVNRMLKRDGDINPAWKKRLDSLFGTSEWYDEFYETVTQSTLFGQETRIEKVANFDAIGSYFIRRLKGVFAGVIDKPLYLYNSRNIPLYMLCFAVGNPDAKRAALNIARDILGK